ncbi:hypothetical protein [Lysobacter sp. TY2-98]|uniref:hypothetical protein n=1 Tax=Lysobacter sp. TY2-98 TaxID=2290922 RepID=UPI0013B39CC0|nr:hypothetical protein [Lysobacter sp. TY2-98]
MQTTIAGCASSCEIVVMAACDIDKIGAALQKKESPDKAGAGKRRRRATSMH